MSDIKVLLIEDDPVQARVMRTAFAKFSASRYELASAASLAEGLGLLNERPFDVVLLDLTLPDADGIETLLRLREQRSDVPVVVLTGLDDDELAVEAMRAGAQDYIVKGQSDPQPVARATRHAVERDRLLRTLSLTDDLTGLYNRRGFTTLAEQHFKARRRLGRDALFFYADMDGLKRINDTFGHDAGSRALAKIADVLRETFRTTDIIARIGGDEFAVLAPDSSPDNAEIITERLRHNLDEVNRREEMPYRLALSVGVARVEATSDKTFDEVMSEADEAMYQQKRERRGHARSEQTSSSR